MGHFGKSEVLVMFSFSAEGQAKKSRLLGEAAVAVFAVPSERLLMWDVGGITGQHNSLSVGGHERKRFGIGGLCFRVNDDFVLVRNSEDPLVQLG
jgi:hypothetical protein